MSLFILHFKKRFDLNNIRLRFEFSFFAIILLILLFGIPTPKLHAQEPLPLDAYPNAYAGYSLRQLRSGYSGPAIRIRRNSDNTEQDIGFTVNGWLDTTAAKIFVGDNTGYVTMWYNQVPGEPNLVQNSSDAQPLIIQNGQIITDENNKPVIYFENSTKSLKALSFSTPIILNNYTFFSVLKADASWDGGETNFAGIWGENDHAYQGAVLRGVQSYINTASVRFGDTATNLTMNHRSLFIMRNSGNSADIWQGHVVISSSSLADNAVLDDPNQKSSLTVGAGFPGILSEFIVYPQALTDNSILDLYRDITSTWNVGPVDWNSQAILPQQYNYQVTLYNWLATITPSQVTLPQSDISWDGTTSGTNELSDLYLQMDGATASRVVRGDPDWYVLDAGNGKGIEATGSVRILDEPGSGYPGNPPRSWANEPAFLYQLHVPNQGGEGNPYYHLPAMGYRALILAMVDMMMYHQEMETGDYASWTDMYGKALLGWAETFKWCKNLLPDSVQNAYERGMEYFIEQILAVGPRAVNTNMDMFSMQAAATIYSAVNNITLKSKCIQAVKFALFGYPDGVLNTHHTTADEGPGNDTFPHKGVFSPSGYIMEGGQPDVFYGGESLYHLTGALAAVTDKNTGEVSSDWNFLKEVVERLVKFKMYQRFYDPGTNSPAVGGLTNRYVIDGPSGFCGRTGAAEPLGQANEIWKFIYLADQFQMGEPFLVSRYNQSGIVNTILPTQSSMTSSINSKISSLNTELSTVYTNTPPEWNGWSPWTKPTPYLPPNGWYDRLATAISSNDSSLYIPLIKDRHYNVAFGGTPTGDEYWAYKNNDGHRDWGFYVEGDRHQGPYGGWYGGKLEMFWTSTTGIVIASRHGKTGCNAADHEDSECFDNLEWKAANHVWGRDENGNGFTTLLLRGKELQRTSTFDLDATAPSVSVFNMFNDPSVPSTSSRTGEETGAEIQGNFSVTNTFVAVSDGIRITHTIDSDQTDQFTELWASIPVFLRHYNPLRVGDDAQLNMEDTSIEYWNGTSWVLMPEDTNGDGIPEMVSTIALRLGRDYQLGAGPQYVYVAFQGTQHVRLATQVYYDPYQTKTGVRTVHIDLHGDPGTVKTLPPETTVTYTIQTLDPTIPNNQGSFLTPDGRYHLTLDSEAGSVLTDFGSSASPATTNARSDTASFPYGLINFTLEQVNNGETTTIDLTLPPDAPQITSYWKYGPTPDNPVHHWYEFPFNGQTGAEINGNVIHLHITDGGFGDDDLTANGVIVDDGGPVALSVKEAK